ncbi:MAG: type II secretion system protein [Gallionellaceae bacterium]|nr:type II secretion system protein [Gallionellaceae bacterium]
MKNRIEDRGSRIESPSGIRGTQGLTRSPILNPRSSKGFTLIELIVVICLVAIFASVLLERVLFYQEQAEKAAMEQVASALQSALTMQHGRLLARGMESDITTLAADNPMSWLAKIPKNYSGEFYDVSPRSVAPGNWMFDLKTRNLVYILDRGNFFTPGKDGHKWIHFRVNFLYEASPDKSGKGKQELVGTLFEPTEPYRWFD